MWLQGQALYGAAWELWDAAQCYSAALGAKHGAPSEHGPAASTSLLGASQNCSSICTTAAPAHVQASIPGTVPSAHGHTESHGGCTVLTELNRVLVLSTAHLRSHLQHLGVLLLVSLPTTRILPDMERARSTCKGQECALCSPVVPGSGPPTVEPWGWAWGCGQENPSSERGTEHSAPAA